MTTSVAITQEKNKRGHEWSTKGIRQERDTAATPGRPLIKISQTQGAPWNPVTEKRGSAEPKPDSELVNQKAGTTGCFKERVLREF